MSIRTREAVSGGAAGIGALLVSYFVTYLAAGSTVQSSAARQLFEAVGGELPTWKVVGWVLFNAYGATARLPGLLGTNAVNLISQVDAFSSALFVVPPLVLLAAGAVVGFVADEDQSALGASVAGLVGASLLTAVLLVFVTRVSLGDTTLGPVLVPAVGLAGIGYPLVFGGVGTFAGQRLSS
jgi:hypothetical protein